MNMPAASEWPGQVRYGESCLGTMEAASQRIDCLISAMESCNAAAGAQAIHDIWKYHEMFKVLMCTAGLHEPESFSIKEQSQAYCHICAGELA